ncbi:MAG: phage tail tube protein [Pelagimonas sp.]|uniref:phage tail tube protein n=1 Tax=Pelagimonas sp. TaxID=2073170 RepID=UPI003D6A996D
MSNARGDNTQLLMRQQAQFGAAEAAAEGAFRLLPFYSYDLDPSEELSTDDAIRGDSFPGEIIAGLQTMSGGLVVPMALQSIGWHFANLFGAPETSEPSTGNFQHIFAPSAVPTPGLQTVGKNFLGPNLFFVQDSVVYKGFEIAAKKEGQRPRINFDVLGRQEIKAGAALDTTPVEYANDVAPVGFTGKAKIDGALAAAITGLTGKVSSEAEMDQEEMNGLATASDVDLGDWMMDGSIDTRFRDATYYDMATNGTLVDLSLEYALSPTVGIEFTFFNARLERKGVPITNREVISASFNFRVGRPGAGQSPFQILLKNDVASYGNPS